jgi:hypothetical protein
VSEPIVVVGTRVRWTVVLFALRKQYGPKRHHIHMRPVTRRRGSR